jgi:hypothetical protein
LFFAEESVKSLRYTDMNFRKWLEFRQLWCWISNLFSTATFKLEVSLYDGNWVILWIGIRFGHLEPVNIQISLKSYEVVDPILNIIIITEGLSDCTLLLTSGPDP